MFCIFFHEIKPMITNYLETIFLNNDKLCMIISLWQLITIIHVHIGNNDVIKWMPLSFKEKNKDGNVMILG